MQDTISGGLLGEVGPKVNKAKVLYGLPKEESTAILPLQEDEDAPSSSKKKKPSSGHKDKRKADPNAPPIDRFISFNTKNCYMVTIFENPTARAVGSDEI